MNMGLRESKSLTSRWVTLSALLLVFGMLSSCATVQGWRGGGKESGGIETAEATTALEAGATTNELESELLRLVKAYKADVEADSANNQSRIIRKKPYFFKEYSNYMSEVRADDVVLTETESRTAPYAADVTLEKVRHVTRLHRSRDEARLDNNFLRDSGSETLSYELRNGRWTRVGSFFLAESTEEQVNGEWVAVQRNVQRTVEAEEPKKGWFGRSWTTLTGKE